MTGPDRLAAHVAANIQHAQRLGSLYRVARSPDPDPEALRLQIQQAALALAASDLSSLAAVEDASRAVAGMVRVVGALRAAMGANDG